MTVISDQRFFSEFGHEPISILAAFMQEQSQLVNALVTDHRYVLDDSADLLSASRTIHLLSYNDNEYGDPDTDRGDA